MLVVDAAGVGLSAASDLQPQDMTAMLGLLAEQLTQIHGQLRTFV